MTKEYSIHHYKDKSLNIKKLVKLWNEFKKEFWETPLTALDFKDIFINHEAMEQIAPKSEWTLKYIHKGNYGYYINKFGTVWFALTDQKIEEAINPKEIEEQCR